jgi:hypothetical protein
MERNIVYQYEVIRRIEEIKTGVSFWFSCSPLPPPGAIDKGQETSVNRPHYGKVFWFCHRILLYQGRRRPQDGRGLVNGAHTSGTWPNGTSLAPPPNSHCAALLNLSSIYYIGQKMALFCDSIFSFVKIFSAFDRLLLVNGKETPADHAAVARG